MGGRATGSQSNTGVGKIAVWGEGMIGISWRVLSNWAAPLSVCCQPAHRKRIEEAFGWIKTVAGQDKTKFRGRDRVGWAFTFAAAAYNLARLPKLLEASS